MPWLIVALSWLAALPVLAALGGRGALARRAGWAVGALTLLVPWALPASAPLLRAAVAVLAGVSLARYAELGAGPRWPWARRLWHLVAVVDTRAARRTRPRFDARRALAAVAWLGLAALGLVLAFRAPALLIRWAGGAVFVYALVDGISALLRAGYAALGWELPPLHQTPIASRSLAEFWGARWNRTVSAWLREHWLVPCMRRRWPLAGLVGSFLWSGLFHAYFTLAAVGPALAAAMLTFFCIQALATAAERALALRRWPRFARAYALVALIASSPLFVEPALQILSLR